jgi:Domain of unknown function (DUF4279)
MKQLEYVHDYPVCLETYSMLRIFSDKLSPAEIKKALAITPTESFKKGEAHGKNKKNRFFRKTNGWFYSTDKLTSSRDTRQHIDLILEALNRKGKALKTLHKKGCQINIVSYYVSTGQGGPALWPYQMLKLGKLGIEIWWDIYFSEEKN